MNPSSRLAPRHRERDVEGLGAALKEHGDAIALLHVAGDALELLERAHPLAVHLADLVAASYKTRILAKGGSLSVVGRFPGRSAQ